MLRELSLAVVLSAFLLTGVAPLASAQEPQGGSATGAPKTKEAAVGDGGLERRVEQLEEQLVDLQVVIGTLESLARGGGAQEPRQAWSSGGSGADQARIDALETQVRALAAEVERLSGRASVAAPLERQGAASPGSAPGAAPSPYATTRFGETTVTSANGDPIGGLLQQEELPPVGGAQATPRDPGGVPPGGVAALDPATTEAESPKQLYERAYGYMLQQNFAAAQSDFTDFLKRYPNDSLVPDALYWLGETHYVQRNYADAAEAFDLVTQGYRSSAKAPDSLLKRGMALAALGKKDDACGILGRLPAAYPSASPALKAKAGSERQRLGCP